MTRGKFGITLSAVAALSFILAFFGYTEILVVVAGFALITEGNNWLTKQVLQALYLRLGFSVIITVMNWFFTGLQTLSGWFKTYNAINVLSDINRFLNTALSIALLVICAIALARVLREEDANLPVVEEYANKSLGIISKRAHQPQYTAQTQVKYQQYQTQQPQNQYAQPFQQPPKENNYTQYEKTDTAPPANQATVLQPDPVPITTEWACSCGKMNTGKFCSVCGKKNPNI